MARLNTAIDIKEVDRSAGGSGSFELVPFGDYVLELSAITQKTIDGGVAHEYVYEVIEPEQFAKRRIWDTVMLDHPTNVGWVKASLARIAKLSDAVGFDAEREGELDPMDGKYKLVDDDVLLYRAFLAKVVQREGNPKGDGTKYNDSNEVIAFYNPNDPGCPTGPSIYEVQPAILPPRGKKKPTAAPANDNRPAARPAAAQAATGATNRPWPSRAA
jgi:hypothetical protein